MTVHARQMTFDDLENAEYREFVEKFKQKKTTDDCYTPENIYDCVADWACRLRACRRRACRRRACRAV